MSRNDQASRILRIISLLEQSSEGMPVPEIMSSLTDQGFSCTRRTIYRDLEAIQNCGFPVENSDSGADSGIWRLSKLKTFGTKVVVTYEELLALFLARESLKVYEGTSLYKSLESFFHKFEEMLGATSLLILKDFCTSIGFKSKSQWANNVPKSFLDELHRATSEGFKVKVKYLAVSGTTAGVVSERLIGPECVYFADSGAYIVAKDFDKDAIRVFSLSRIKEVSVLADSYVSSIDSPETYFAENFGVFSGGVVTEVKINIEAPHASYVQERKWHKSQKIEVLDKSVLLTLHVKVNDELVGWVLSLGASATVIEPESLKAKLLEQLDNIKSNYSFKKAA